MTTDDRAGGPPAACGEMSPEGEPCALEVGHAGNHLTAADIPQSAGSYVVQAGAIVLLVVLVGWILPLPIDGFARVFVSFAVVVATLAWVTRRR